MVKLISSNFQRYYYAPFASFSGLLCFFLYFFSILIALMLTFSNENFWTKGEYNLLRAKWEYTGKYYLRYIDGTGALDLSNSNIGVFSSQQSNTTLPTLAEIDSADGQIEFEVVLKEVTPLFLAAYPIFRLTVDDYISMVVEDSVGITFQGKIPFDLATASGVMKLKQNRPYQYQFGNSEYTLTSALELMAKFEPEAHFLSRVYQNETLGAEYQVTYGTGEKRKLFIRLSLPTQLNVLTEPGPVHTFKVRFVRFVYYFIPLFFISHWLMQMTYENKLSQVFTVTDFPQELAEKKTGH